MNTLPSKVNTKMVGKIVINQLSTLCMSALYAYYQIALGTCGLGYKMNNKCGESVYLSIR